MDILGVLASSALVAVNCGCQLWCRISRHEGDSTQKLLRLYRNWQDPCLPVLDFFLLQDLLLASRLASFVTHC